jgi:hypothetical protein
MAELLRTVNIGKELKKPLNEAGIKTFVKFFRRKSNTTGKAGGLFL